MEGAILDLRLSRDHRIGQEQGMVVSEIVDFH